MFLHEKETKDMREITVSFEIGTRGFMLSKLGAGIFIFFVCACQSVDCAEPRSVDSRPLVLDTDELVESFFLSPDKPLVLGLTESKLIVWEIAEKKCNRVFACNRPVPLRKLIILPRSNTVVLSEFITNKLVAIDFSTKIGMKQVIDLEKNECVREIAASSDGRLIITGTSDEGATRFWKQSDGKLTEVGKILPRKEQSVQSIAYSDKTKLTALGYEDGAIELFGKTVDGTYISKKKIKTSCERIDQILLTDTTVLVFSYTSVIKNGTPFSRQVKSYLYSIQDGVVNEQLLSENTEPAADWCLLGNNETVLLAQQNGLIVQWNLASGKKIRQIKLDKPIRSIKSGNNSHVVAVQHTDDTIVLLGINQFSER
jgi:WD40 repeat protein